MERIMNIQGKLVTLRAIEYDDMELLRSMLNDPDMEKLVVGWSFPVSSEEQRKWYEKSINDKTNLRFIIETKEKQALGIATLTSIDWKNRKATHGIKLANNVNRQRGIGTDTVMAIMRYAFDELNLNRLDGSWYEDNIPSQKLYIKCGWKIEGCRRNYLFKNGGYKNLILTGILAEEYYDLVRVTGYWQE